MAAPLGGMAMTARVTTLKGPDAGAYYVDAFPSYDLDASEPRGRWHGRGADALGLHGDVADDGFLDLMAGTHPGSNGTLLGRRHGDTSVRRFDITAKRPQVRVGPVRHRRPLRPPRNPPTTSHLFLFPPISLPFRVAFPDSFIRHRLRITEPGTPDISSATDPNEPREAEWYGAANAGRRRASDLGAATPAPGPTPTGVDPDQATKVSRLGVDHQRLTRRGSVGVESGRRYVPRAPGDARAISGCCSGRVRSMCMSACAREDPCGPSGWLAKAGKPSLTFGNEVELLGSIANQNDLIRRLTEPVTESSPQPS